MYNGTRNQDVVGSNPTNAFLTYCEEVFLPVLCENKTFRYIIRQGVQIKKEIWVCIESCTPKSNNNTIFFINLNRR